MPRKRNSDADAPVDDGKVSLLIKQLLQDVERTGQSRYSFNLADHCEGDTSLFGKAGSSLRTKISRRWSKIKERRLLGYISLLEENGVTPGRSTLQELKDFRANQNMARNKSARKNNNADDNLSTSSPMGDDDDLQTKQTSRGSSSRSSARGSRLQGDPAGHAEGGNDDLDVPDVVQWNGGAGFGSPSTSHHRFGFTSLLINQVSQTSTPGAFVPLSAQAQQHGTRQQPWIVEVNVQYPERNNGFRIEFVDQLVHGPHIRSGFHIRKKISAPDIDNWSAYVPEGHWPAKYNNRLVMVQGPSMDWCDRAANENEADNNKCKTTINALRATSNEIEEDPDRHWQFWILVFPANIVLNNQIFSDDDSFLPSFVDVAFMKHSNSDNPFGRDLRETTNCWNIAIKNGRRHGTRQRKQDLKKVFKE